MKVRIEYKKAVEVPEDANVDAVHFDKKDESAEIIDADVNVTDTTIDTVEFKSDQFSVYGVVGTETLETDVLASDGNRYKITAKFDVDAEIPKGADLVVEEIPEGSEEYDAAMARSQEFFDQELTYGRFFDISIQKDGEKVIPKDSVEITISIEDTIALARGTEMKTIHFGEDKTEVLSTSVSGTSYDSIIDVDEMSFSTDGFSTFGSTGASVYKTVQLRAAAANIETTATVNVSGVGGQTTKEIRTGLFDEEQNASIVIDGYRFKEAWYRDIPLEGLYYDGEVFYGTIDGNRITGVEINPAEVTLYYEEGSYSVDYVVVLDGETLSDHSGVMDLTGPIAVSTGDYIEFYAKPKTGYSVSSITASNGQINNLGNYYYRLGNVTGDTTVTLELTEILSYSFTFAGSNTIINFNGTQRYSGQGLTSTYTSANSIRFSLDGYDQWGTTGTYALNKLSVTIDGVSISANIPDTQGSSAETVTDNGYTITVIRGATNEKQGQKGTCSFPVYDVTITAPGGEKVRGDIALDTNYKVITSSEVVAKQLDGVEPLAYYGYKGNSNSGSYTNSDTASGDENKRLSDTVFSKYPRDQGYNHRGLNSNSNYYVKLTGQYSAEDLYLTVVDYHATSNTFINVISETKVSTLNHINNSMLNGLNRNGSSTYSTNDYMFTIGPNSSYSRGLTDIRIYIVYKPKPDQEYTVSYDLDGGTATPAPTDGGTYVQDGEPVSITTTLPAKEGKVFQGWYLEGDPNTIYHSRDVFAVTEDSVRYANADHEFVFKAKWADQKTAILAPYTVNVYLQNEDGTYDDGLDGRKDNPYINNIEHGEVGTTAYVIRTELEAWLTELKPTWSNDYEYDKESLDLIVAEGSAVVKVYYKRIWRKGNIQVTKHFDVQDLYLDGTALDHYRNELTITITGPMQEDGTTYSKTLKLSNFTFDGDHTYKWQDYQVAVGEYHVVESGETDLLPGYALTGTHVKETDITVTERSAAGGYSEGTPLENHYRGQKGTLNVKKTVAGVRDDNKEFKFIIKNTDLGADDGNGNPTGMYVKDENAQYFTSNREEAFEFTIKHNGTVIKQLPAGNYVIEELYTGEGEAAQIENYDLNVTYSGNTNTAVVTKDQSTDFTITNTYTRKTVSMTVIKTVVGPEDTSEFSIKVSASDEGTEITTYPAQPEQEEGVTVEDHSTNCLDIKMKAGTTAKLTIPAGATLKIEENEYSNYTTTYKVNGGQAGTSAVIDKVKDGDKVEVINTRKPVNVTVIKNVEGTDEDKALQFTFNATGLAETSFQLYGAAAEGKANTKQFQNVDCGTVISVSEVMPTGVDYFDTNIVISYKDSSGNTQTSEMTGLASGNITLQSDTTITFTNKRNRQKVVVYKISADDKQPLGGAAFMLNGLIYTSRDDDLMKGYTEEIELPVCTTPYALEEIKAPDGYNPPKNNILITVSPDGVKYQQSDNNANAPQDAELENGRYKVTVTNSSGVELPMTGGTGTLLYTLSGLILIIASALMYGFRMRRRERRLR